ncbi:unnamed protein product, partial [Musa hybrid cultivar]
LERRFHFTFCSNSFLVFSISSLLEFYSVLLSLFPHDCKSICNFLDSNSKSIIDIISWR